MPGLSLPPRQLRGAAVVGFFGCPRLGVTLVVGLRRFPFLVAGARVGGRGVAVAPAVVGRFPVKVLFRPVLFPICTRPRFAALSRRAAVLALGAGPAVRGGRLAVSVPRFFFRGVRLFVRLFRSPTRGIVVARLVTILLIALALLPRDCLAFRMLAAFPPLLRVR